MLGNKKRKMNKKKKKTIKDPWEQEKKPFWKQTQKHRGDRAHPTK